MPKTRIVFYCEEDGWAPVLEWLDGLSTKARVKCRIKIERLAQLGHELRRPEADVLRDGIHELRIGFQGLNYRVLYFFHGNVAAVLAHGIEKERRVPDNAINVAIERRLRFETNPRTHSRVEE